MLFLLCPWVGILLALTAKSSKMIAQPSRIISNNKITIMDNGGARENSDTDY